MYVLHSYSYELERCVYKLMSRLPGAHAHNDAVCDVTAAESPRCVKLRSNAQAAMMITSRWSDDESSAVNY